MTAHFVFDSFQFPVRIGLYDLLKIMDVVTQVLAQAPVEVNLRSGR